MNAINQCWRELVKSEGKISDSAASFIANGKKIISQIMKISKKGGLLLEQIPLRLSPFYCTQVDKKQLMMRQRHKNMLLKSTFTLPKGRLIILSRRQYLGQKQAFFP